MKKFFALVCTVLIAFVLAIISFAHPGGTDGSGGHYDRSTGEYHYHHGYSAHQHEDGDCPYDFNDNTNNSYDDSGYNSSSFFHKVKYAVKDISKFVITLAIVLALSMFPCKLIIFDVLGSLLSKVLKKNISDSNPLFYFYLFFHITISVVISIIILNA